MSAFRAFLASSLFAIAGCSASSDSKKKDLDAPPKQTKTEEAPKKSEDAKQIETEPFVRFEANKKSDPSATKGEDPGGGTARTEWNDRRPTSDDAVLLLKERVARDSSDDGARFRLALLHLAEGDLVEAERNLSSMRNRSDKLLPFIEAYLYRQLGDHQNAGKILNQLLEDWRRSDGFKIERAELCERVYGYRRYKLPPDSKIPPGGMVHLYVEPKNFALKHDGERRTLHFTYDWKLFDDRNHEIPVPLWEKCDQDARVDIIQYQGPVTAFHQSFHLKLPENLAMGEYKIRVTVRDDVAQKSDFANVGIYVTAR